MSVEPDKNTGCPTESNKCDIDCGDCAKSHENVAKQETKKQPRSVRFPEDEQIVTQYFEPANPWHDVASTTRSQLAAEYLESCRRHNTPCIDSVLEQIRELPETSIGGSTRAGRLTLSECVLLGAAPADALEAVLRKVQFRRIEIDHAAIDDEGAEAIFDMIEYYESANVVGISGPRQFGIRGWQAASRMIKKSAELSELEVTDSELEASHAPVLARSLRPVTCRLRALCLQRVYLCGEPLLCLVIALKSNSSIRELRLGDNSLTMQDATQLASLLRYNNRIQLLDLSNNQIQDAGLGQLADAMAEQAAQSPPSAAASPLSPHRCQVGGHESRGLAFLVLWNNQLTRNCAPHLSKALRSCSSLCVLNIGRNALGSEAVRAAHGAHAVVSLGLQAARLGPDAAHALAELVRQHTKLQRLDLRENRLGSVGLQAILNAMKDNTTLTQIDLDEPPESSNLLAEDSEMALVRRLTREIRTLCRRNEPPMRQDEQHPVHRKISLTCHTACLLRQGLGGEEERRVGRLRSPAPSPAPSPSPSPAGSPVPAPHPNSRFLVTRVTPERDSSSDSCPSTPTRPTYCHTPSRFRVVQVMEPPQIQVHLASTPRKTSSRFSVTRNYDTVYNPTPSPPNSPACVTTTKPITATTGEEKVQTVDPTVKVLATNRQASIVREGSSKMLPESCSNKALETSSSKVSGCSSMKVLEQSSNVLHCSSKKILESSLAKVPECSTMKVLETTSNVIQCSSKVIPESSLTKEILECSAKNVLATSSSKVLETSSNVLQCSSKKVPENIPVSIHKVQTIENLQLKEQITKNTPVKDILNTNKTLSINTELIETATDKLVKEEALENSPSIITLKNVPTVENIVPTVENRVPAVENKVLTVDNCKKTELSIKDIENVSKALVSTSSDKVENIVNTPSLVHIPEKLIVNNPISTIISTEIVPSIVHIPSTFVQENVPPIPIIQTTDSLPTIENPIEKKIPDLLTTAIKDLNVASGTNVPKETIVLDSQLKSELQFKDKLESSKENNPNILKLKESAAHIKNTSEQLDKLKGCLTNIAKTDSKNESKVLETIITVEKPQDLTKRDDKDTGITDKRDVKDNTASVIDNRSHIGDKCNEHSKINDDMSVTMNMCESDLVLDNVKQVKCELKYSDVVKNTNKLDQNNTMKQITDDLGNILKEMKILVKDIEVPVKDIVLKKNKSESSLDSPDLEVSRLTEKMSRVFDSSSSLEISGSSMESLNGHNKTVQELDRRKGNVIQSGGSLESDVTPANSNLLNLSVSSNDSVSPIFGKTKQIHDSLSSLEASVSSLDSGKHEKLMVTSADSGIEYSLQNPIENKEDNSSNEGTLTNNSSLKDSVKKSDNLDSTSSPKRASSLLDVPALKNKGLDRMRKISWVAPSSSFHIPKPEEKDTKPSHLEKLLSLFQHPSSIFSRSSASDDEKKSNSSTPPRKDSSLTSSFWSWGSTIEREKEDDSSEATDSTLSEKVQVSFVDESFSRKLDSKTPSTDTDNTLSEFQSFPHESESEKERERVTVTTEDTIVQKIDLSVNSKDLDIAKTGATDLVKEKENVIIEKEDIARPRSFAAVLKSSGSENSLDKQNSPDSGQPVDKLPSKVIRGLKENISPENTLTSSMTTTKTLAEELERQVKSPLPLLEVTLKYEPKIEDVKTTSDLAPIATIEETDDIPPEYKKVDMGKDALSYLMYENKGFDTAKDNIVRTAMQGSLAEELKQAEIKEILDLSPELVVDENIENAVFVTKEVIPLKTSPIVPDRAKLKKSNSLEDLSISEEKTSPKTKTIAFKVPESTTPRDIPERRSKLRSRSGSSPKSLPECLNKPCPLTKMESILTKKKKKVSSLGKMARDSLLALNMSDEEIAEFRRSYKLTSVESLKSLESVSEDANSQSGNSMDSRCRACLRTSQESLMSLDSITEDCRCTDDCEKPGRSAR